MQPAREALDAALTAATSLEVRDLADARRRAAEQTSFAYSLLLGGAGLAVAVAGLMTDLARADPDRAGPQPIGAGRDR